MFIEVKLHTGQLCTLNLMHVECVMTDDDGQTIIYTGSGKDAEIPWRTNEPYDALIARLEQIVPMRWNGWRAPA